MKPFSPDDIWLAHLDNAIQQNISDVQLSVERLADIMRMSRAHFYRKLGSLTDITPKEYIQDIRFNHAHQLLEQGKMESVKAVAHAVGIQKVRYFSEQFKKRFEVLPSDMLH
jgi:AraC-like DNA-binding protein